ncbi:PREDICTED: uncharacterized protein LOC108358740 [Rhagoletis zephyria]|uniref:uncharacterized protein LOC108358740 n=1 Tax=Rhagoletis zephyria TaxID=28612 RepID=UPI00081132BA|nr:PREDICTED: uncharacterized protein LOC108358740 [Rhagoletis zephyria]
MESTVWTHLCKGTVSQELKIKYKDQMTYVGIPFKMMNLANDRTSILVSFYQPDIMNCTVLSIDNNFTMHCDHNLIIHEKGSMVYCFNFHLQYLTDLMHLCFDQEDNLAKIPYRITFAAIHYGRIPPLRSVQIRLNWKNKWILLLICAVLAQAM